MAAADSRDDGPGQDRGGQEGPRGELKGAHEFGRACGRGVSQYIGRRSSRSKTGGGGKSSDKGGGSTVQTLGGWRSGLRRAGRSEKGRGGLGGVD